MTEHTLVINPYLGPPSRSGKKKNNNNNAGITQEGSMPSHVAKVRILQIAASEVKTVAVVLKITK